MVSVRKRGARTTIGLSAILFGIAISGHAAGPAPATADASAPSAQPGTVRRSLEPPNGALVVAGKPPDATLLCTGDVIGYIDPCG